LLDRFGVRLWVSEEESNAALAARLPLAADEESWPALLEEARLRLKPQANGARHRRGALTARLEAAYIALAPGSRLFPQLHERLGGLG
jgi:hypothetical protein